MFWKDRLSRPISERGIVIFDSPKNHSKIVYSFRLTEQGVFERVEVRGSGTLLEAIGDCHNFALKLQTELCSGYSGRI